MKKRILALLVGSLMLLTACGSSDDMAADFVSSNHKEASAQAYGSGSYGYDNGYYETGEAKVATEESAAGTDGILNGEKLVYTCDLTIESLDYDKCVESIKASISEYGGIIERESESDDAYNWYYKNYVKTRGTRALSMTVRIPSEKYYAFLNSLEGSGKITSKNSYVENISKRYYETDALIKSLEIQQERLLGMMEQAETIEDMITIESRLSEVQYQLNSAKNSLSSMDADVEYSTVSIYVGEVMEYTPTDPVQKSNTFLDRLKNTLTDTWEFFWNMLEFLLFLAIRLIPVALLVTVVVLIFRPILRKRKQKKLQKKQNAANQQAAQGPQNLQQ